MELLYLLDNTLGETCCLNESRNTIEYICHSQIVVMGTASGVPVKLNRKDITLVDALVIPSALSTQQTCSFSFNKARYYIVCPFQTRQALQSKLDTVDGIVLGQLSRTPSLLHQMITQTSPRSSLLALSLFSGFRIVVAVLSGDLLEI